MESMESHKAGFPPFPHSLEIPSGFPRQAQLDRRIRGNTRIESLTPSRIHRCRKSENGRVKSTEADRLSIDFRSYNCKPYRAPHRRTQVDRNERTSNSRLFVRYSE